MKTYTELRGNPYSRFGQERQAGMDMDEEERMRRLRELFSGRFRTNMPMRRSTGSTGGSGRGGTGGNAGGGSEGGTGGPTDVLPPV